MKQIITKIPAGASKPFRLLHVSDTHLCLCDERNDERKQRLAEARSKTFPNAETHLDETAALAKRESLTVVHTGDLIDFVSEANLDRAKEFTSECDVFFAAGNHEFSLYVGEAWEDEAYRNQSLAHVQESFKNDIRFSVREVNGVKLVAIDNSYYRFDKPQLDALRAVAAEGRPIILFMHNPLYEPSLYAYARPKGDAAYLVSTPEELMRDYSDHRFKQQKADEITLEATDFIKTCGLVKAILTGHLHYDFESTLECGIPQLVTGIGTARIINVN